MSNTTRGIAIATALAATLVSGHRLARAAACDSNLIIVLDRSCSMKKVPAGDTRSKWQIAEEAIGQLTTTYEGQLRYGLIMFPDEGGGNCKQDQPIYVNTATGTEQAVRDAIAGTAPDGPCVTNIDTAMEQVSSDPAFDGTPDPSGRRGFVLLITDGKQSGSCGGNTNDPITVANIEALYNAGYPTYVVGFGDGVDPADLDSFAVAGGVPRMGTPMYYQADDAAALSAALDAIAGSIVGDPELGGCTGTPCPDGRCFGSGETCVDSVCVVPRADAGPQPDAGSGTDGDGGMGGGGATGDTAGGCCGTGQGGAPASLLFIGVVAAFLRRRR